jgi:hypothetical protein
MAVISIIIAILFLVLVGWTWHNLGGIGKIEKIKFIVSGIIIIYVLIYSISKIGIAYENQEAMRAIRTVFVMLFTIVNGYIILPYIFRKLEQINNNEIEKEKLKKSIIILAIIIFILALIEIKYFADIQQSIISLYSTQVI